MTDDALAILGCIGLVVGVASLLAVIVLSVVVWCLWRKMKGELLSLSESLQLVLATEMRWPQKCAGHRNAGHRNALYEWDLIVYIIMCTCVIY